MVMSWISGYVVDDLWLSWICGYVVDHGYVVDDLWLCFGISVVMLRMICDLCPTSSTLIRKVVHLFIVNKPICG